MALTVKPIGRSGDLVEVGGSTFKALHDITTPLDGGGNHTSFSAGLSSGIMAAGLAANAELFQFRWSDATRYAVVRKIRMSAALSTTVFAAGVPWQIDLVKCNTWTAAGTGGTRLTPAGLLKKRINLSATLVFAGDIAIASTTGLGAGTKVLEGAPMTTAVAPCPTSTAGDTTMLDQDHLFFQAEVGDGEHPLVLHQNEGFVIRSVAIQALGTWQFRVHVDWMEAEAY